MKKVMMLLAAVLGLTATSYAGAFYWAVDYNGWSMPEDSIAYVVSVTSTTTVDKINSYITTNGLNVANLASVAWSYENGAYLNEADGYAKSVNFVPNTDYYLAVLVVNTNNTVVVANEILTVTPLVTDEDNMGPPETADAAYMWTADSANALSTGSNPNVPEPTALALLALGVAGLALKRKVA